MDVDVSLKPHVWYLFDPASAKEFHGQRGTGVGEVENLGSEDNTSEGVPGERIEDGRIKDVKNRQNQAVKNKNVIFGPGGSVAASAIYQVRGLWSIGPRSQRAVASCTTVAMKP